MPKRAAKRKPATAPDPAPPQPAAAKPPEPPPGPALAGTLGLIALFFLAAPFTGAGYSGAGYQVGLVLLPVAAAIAWGTSAERPRGALIVLLLLGLSGALMPLWIHPGWLLWYYVMHAAWAWAAVWVLLRELPSRARWLLPVITLSALLTAAMGWAAHFMGETPGNQITGSFGLHNAYAGYLLLAWPAAALGLAQAARPLWRWLYGLAALGLIATLLFTYSRAAWLVLGLQVLALLGWLAWRRIPATAAARSAWRPLLLLGGGAVLVTLAVFALPFARGVLGSYGNLADYSVQGRLTFWRAALRIFAAHPLAGVGPGDFAYVFPQYQPDWRYYSVDPHSWPLQLLCELGLPGLLVLTAVLLGVWLWLRRLWRGHGGAPALLLSLAVLGSLAHAAVDFDYTFGATTALLGALLAYGAHLAHPAPHVEPADLAAAAPSAKPPLWQRLAVALTVAAWLLAAALGQVLTLERYTLDRLRDTAGLSSATRLGLLQDAVRIVPFNFRTRYQLASLLAQPGRGRDVPAAQRELAACLRLNPRYAMAWALLGRLAGPGAGDRYLESALALDPYNYPEHYYLYASLAQDGAQRLARLQLGLKRIPIDDPITPQHIRPTWYRLNPLMVDWYEEMSRLAADEQERQLYARRAVTFRQYWKLEQERQGASPAPAPAAASSA